MNCVDLWGLTASDSKNSLAEIRNGIATPLGESWDELANVTSPWGKRDSFVTGNGVTSSGHKGMDFGAPQGTRVNSIKAGTVTTVETDPDNKRGYGLYTEITHENGTHSFYAHQSKIIVEEGQHVETGEKIGEVGSTGLSTGNHLHFGYDGNGDGIYSDTEWVDNPATLLFSGEE